MKKYYVIGIIFLACVFSISEGRSEIALTQEQGQKAAKIDSVMPMWIPRKGWSQNPFSD
jgi:hypothetical protein